MLRCVTVMSRSQVRLTYRTSLWLTQLPPAHRTRGTVQNASPIVYKSTQVVGYCRAAWRELGATRWLSFILTIKPRNHAERRQTGRQNALPEGELHLFGAVRHRRLERGGRAGDENRRGAAAPQQ